MSTPVTEGVPAAATTTLATTTTKAAPAAAPPGPGEPGAGAGLLMAKSTDGGRTWEASVVDDSGLVCVRCLTTPEATLDPETGDIYIALGQGDSAPPDARGDRNIWFMRSSDGGRTWSGPVDVMDQTFPRDEVYGSDVTVHGHRRGRDDLRLHQGTAAAGPAFGYAGAP